MSRDRGQARQGAVRVRARVGVGHGGDDRGLHHPLQVLACGDGVDGGDEGTARARHIYPELLQGENKKLKLSQEMLHRAGEAGVRAEKQPTEDEGQGLVSKVRIPEKSWAGLACTSNKGTIILPSASCPVCPPGLGFCWLQEAAVVLQITSRTPWSPAAHTQHALSEALPGGHLPNADQSLSYLPVIPRTQTRDTQEGVRIPQEGQLHAKVPSTPRAHKVAASAGWLYPASSPSQAPPWEQTGHDYLPTYLPICLRSQVCLWEMADCVFRLFPLPLHFS